MNENLGQLNFPSQTSFMCITKLKYGIQQLNFSTLNGYNNYCITRKQFVIQYLRLLWELRSDVISHINSDKKNKVYRELRWNVKIFNLPLMLPLVLED